MHYESLLIMAAINHAADLPSKAHDNNARKVGIFSYRSRPHLQDVDLLSFDFRWCYYSKMTDTNAVGHFLNVLL